MAEKRKWIFFMKLYPLLILFVIMFMSIGYASLNSVDFEISGNATGLLKEYDDIYISTAKASSSNGEEIKFNSINDLLLDMNVILKKQSGSTVTLVITLINASNNLYNFNGVIYAKDLVASQPDIYSNDAIVYSYSSDKTEINPGDTVKVTIKFSYKSYSSSVSPNLKCLLSVDFSKVKGIVQNKIEGSEDIALYDTNNSSEGIVFNGQNSYAIFENEYKFPLTYSVTFKTNIENGIVFGDYDAKTGLGFLGSRIIVNVGTGSSSFTPEFVLSNVFDFDEWYTVDLIYESRTSQRLFVNGVEITKRTGSNYWYWGDETSYLGVRPISNNYSTAYNLDGTIKRFLIYNKLLTESEIMHNYNTSNPDDLIQDSLVTHFEFNN